MRPEFEYGQEVRVVRNVRNDGTFPGVATGTLLIRRGRVGFVRNIGTFLQDQIIYEVHFLEEDCVVGCRQEELIDAEAPWVESRFETREKVRATLALASGGEVIVPCGAEGEVMRVLREEVGEEPLGYIVHFPGHTVQVPETALEAAGQ